MTREIGRRPRVFISYRQDDAAGYGGWIAEHLVRHFGKEHVCIDRDTLPPGARAAAHIEEALGHCDYVLVLVGTRWLEACNEHGDRRLDDPDDVVRRELALALGRGTPVIPVLLDGAALPTAQDLPSDLKTLAECRAVVLTPADLPETLARLAARLREDHERPFRDEMRPHPEPLQSPPEAPLATGNKARVVIIDDDRLFGRLASNELKKHGYQVVVHEGAYGAVTAVRRGNFNVVVVDVKMPGIEGTVIVRALRERPHPTSSRLILTSSMPEEELKQKACDCGADAYFVKQQGFAALCALIEQ